MTCSDSRVVGDTLSRIQEKCPNFWTQCCIFVAMPGPQTYELRWKPDAISKLLRRNKIHDRAELAEAIGISRATAYNLFNADWSGKVTTVVLAQLVGCLGANPATIVETVRASAR
ncbi:hypothetical protein Henu3_gp44 [Mycobacterium phage Henu3]|uniref:HTH cro/C1-type domain-containing protein n=6 Tax=Fionnbharthvirus TaxID=2948708 RepID=A0A410T7X5_9CAUD|nr:transcriptional repressor [Mycobacterium phage Henu3]QAU05033.1 hypothetical protein Henu3_gp44 [Mycobacterium phage Henu3]